MSTSASKAATETGASGLQALVYTSPMHEFDGARGTFSPTTAALIVGQREAVLIDAQFMIYITHGHADHHFGLGPLLERFPRARALATPGVIDYITANSENETGLWKVMFGDRFVRPTVVPEPLNGNAIELGPLLEEAWDASSRTHKARSLPKEAPLLLVPGGLATTWGGSSGGPIRLSELPADS